MKLLIFILPFLILSCRPAKLEDRENTLSNLKECPNQYQPLKPADEEPSLTFSELPEGDYSLVIADIILEEPTNSTMAHLRDEKEGTKGSFYGVCAQNLKAKSRFSVTTAVPTYMRFDGPRQDYSMRTYTLNSSSAGLKFRATNTARSFSFLEEELSDSTYQMFKTGPRTYELRIQSQTDIRLTVSLKYRFTAK